MGEPMTEAQKRSSLALRDYFAAMALEGSLANQGTRILPTGPTRFEIAKAMAAWSYVVADAMLAAREQPEVQPAAITEP
jgi:hypothetical protein